MDTSSGGSLVPIALAVLAIVLGGAGLYFGLTANQQLSPLADTLEEGSSSAARLEKEISGLETRIGELSAQNSDLENTLSRLRVYNNQSERAVRQLTTGLKENRGEIVKLAGRLNEMLDGGQSPASAPAPAATAQNARPEVPDVTGSNEAAPPGNSGAETYTIEGGDTFANIAGKLNVSLQALLDANPDANPRRLRIGQVINVPGN